MSATNRGAERRPDDFYQTPAWCVRRYLEQSRWRYSFDPSAPRWLDPCAGNGAIIRACQGQTLKCKPQWVAVEINPNLQVRVPKIPPEFATRLVIGDFLSPEMTVTDPFDLCIGNPPFKLAQDFIEKGLAVAHKVVFLLRLNFLEGAKRAAFFDKHPCNVHVLPNRPSFTANGRTDATAYAWFEFGEGHGGKISVLATTSKAERLADRVTE